MSRHIGDPFKYIKMDRIYVFKKLPSKAKATNLNIEIRLEKNAL